ncbi:hypothetical protein [Paraburkholderia silvatlantica]|uniref:hypothetical protein n=1 Tax=Paraburkholderia silvatlantica TaxID=321895 RepID=UPI003752DF27
MRAMSEDDAEKFESFNGKLAHLGTLDPLRDVKSTSPHVLQILSFHLICEYLVETWVNFKLNKGENLFKGIEKIGFHNKVFVAKNAGLPKEIFHALILLNDERNDLAHKITKRDINHRFVDDLVDKIDAIKGCGEKVSKLKILEGGREIKITSQILGERLLLALYALASTLRNFIFVDLHLTFSTEL